MQPRQEIESVSSWQSLQESVLLLPRGYSSALGYRMRVHSFPLKSHTRSTYLDTVPAAEAISTRWNQPDQCSQLHEGVSAAPAVWHTCQPPCQALGAQLQAECREEMSQAMSCLWHRSFKNGRSGWRYMNEMISQHIHFPPDSSLLGLRKHIFCFIPTASFEMSQPGSGHGVGGSCSFSIMFGNEHKMDYRLKYEV